MAEKQPVPKDPIQTRSLSMPIFLASAVLMASVAVAGYDEFFGRRPYKGFQKDFQTVYLNYLEVLKPEQEKRLETLLAEADYKDLEKRRDEAQAIVDAKSPAINAEIDQLAADITAVQAAMKDPRAKLSALNYAKEVARSDAKRDAVQAEMAEVKALKHSVALVHGSERSEELDYPGLEKAFADLSKSKAALERKRSQLAKPASDLAKAAEAYVDKNLQGPHPDNVEKLLVKAQAGQIGSEGKTINDILQIHVGEFDWVDRCESCHVGTREPVDMRPWDINATTPGDEPVEHALVFASHPKKDLLKIHDPSVFGCSMCHNGNGRSVTSEEYAHGKNKHWLFPLFDGHSPEISEHLGSYESGCVQCHLNDIKLDYQPSDHVALNDAGEAMRDEEGALVSNPRKSSFNDGRWLFYHKGCWGCHRYEGIDTQPEEIQKLSNEIATLDDTIERTQIVRSLSSDPVEKQELDMKVAGLVTRSDELQGQRVDLKKEVQKVGPNLRNIRAKIRPDWLLPWLLDPAEFRPNTKMPSFFENVPELAEDHATKIAAYLWQHAEDRPDVVTQPRGNAANGAKLFKSRGCLACHTIMDGDATIGDGFAADLSRVGEKANYDFLVRWIKEPDSGVMPNLRLSIEDSRDIATWLMTKKRPDAAYEKAPNLDDPALAEAGAALIRHYGCSGCHDIKGMEADGRIGTELTKEGSKPKERLDFGRLEHNFKKAGLYTHKAFFEEKLRLPGVFGRGKAYSDENGLDRLKMPNFRLDDTEIASLTTILLGSIESQIPQEFRYNPNSRKKAIQEGWWVVKKYNCIGCHQVEPQSEPHLWKMDQYVGKDDQGADKSSQRPPSLVGIGFRTNPKWLAEFLRNPSQTREEFHGNGLRSYLAIRMPTFRMSEREIQKLVRFFGAIDSQPEPYVEPILEPLSAQEKLMARNLFKEVKCVNCHAIGDPERDAKMNAPNLVWADRKLRPEWTTRWLANPAAILPGTNMPSNFVDEYEIELADGRVLLGTDLNVNKGKGRFTPNGGEMIRFAASDLVKSRVTRMVATSVTGDLKNYKGDHRVLMMRYLHEAYDEAEVPLAMPDE